MITLGASPCSGADAPHHDLTVSLFPENASLQARDVITLPPNLSGWVSFELAPDLKVEEVSSNGEDLAVQRFGRVVRVKVPPANAGGGATLTIRYGGRLADPVSQTPVHTEDPTFGVDATITAAGAFLGGGSGWFPEFSGHEATFRLKVETPKDWEAVTSGQVGDRSMAGDWRISILESEVPLPTLTLSAGPYRITRQMAGNIPVSTYFYPQSQQLAPTYLQAAQEYLNLYRDRFGPYPFEKFAVVENFFPTGYGFPSWTLLGSTVVRLPFIVKTSLGHEIAHSWWGTGVRVDYTQGNWSEGLTTYVADHLYKELESAEEARDYRLKILRDYAALVDADNDFPLRRFLRRDSKPSQAIGYGKAAMVFHMVRRQIGDAAFWTALKEVATRHMFDQIAWSDFAQAFGRTARRDMQPFFEQWVQREGAPQIRLENVEVATTPEGYRVSGRLRQQNPTFDLQVPIRLETEGESVATELRISDEGAGFVLKSLEPPVRLLVDPEAHVFRRLSPEEIPPTVNGVRGAQPLVAVISRDLSPEIAEASRMLLAALNREEVKVVSEDKLTRKEQAGNLLFLGLPRDYSAPLLQDGRIRAIDAGYSILGEEVVGSETALFAAITPGNDPNVTWAYFIPSTAEAARVAARKIPHYGKYSYLAFQQGQNQVKGIWEPNNSPLIYNFKN